MAGKHVFVAGGDACPQCEGSAGMLVEPGWRPHDNCNCNTIASDDAADGCTFDYEVEDTWDNGRGGYGVTLSVTVTCPDGRVVSGDATNYQLEGLRAGWGDDFLEMIAHDTCEDACDDQPDEEWLCC